MALPRTSVPPTTAAGTTKTWGADSAGRAAPAGGQLASSQSHPHRDRHHRQLGLGSRGEESTGSGMHARLAGDATTAASR